MALMQPYQPPVNATPGFVQSAYSPGGAYYPTPVNNYNSASPYTNYNFAANSYNNPSQQTQQSYGGIMSPTNVGSIAKSAGQFVSNGFNLPQSQFLNNAGVSLGFGSGGLPAIPSGLGAADTGFLQAAQTASGVGEGAAGAFGSAASFSSVLGAAGIGAFAGNFLGRIGGNSTNGSIGGGVGAGIGMAIAGPPGAIIGGLIGGIGGGFFGPKSPPTSAEAGGGSINATGKVNYAVGGSKNPGAISGYTKVPADSFTRVASSAANDLGIQFNTDLQFVDGISTKHPGPEGTAWLNINNPKAGFDSGKFFFNPDDEASQQSAMLKALTAAAGQSGYTDTAKLGDWYQNQIDHPQQPGMVGGGAPPIIPVTDTQFADYMTKFKGTQNANP